MAGLDPAHGAQHPIREQLVDVPLVVEAACTALRATLPSKDEVDALARDRCTQRGLSA